MMTDQEWETTLTILKRQGLVEEAWSLAQKASPIRSVQLLRQIHEHDREWKPKNHLDRDAFELLMNFAKDCNWEEQYLPPVRFQKLEGHSNRVTCLAISPDGTLLASGSGDEADIRRNEDNTVRLWGLPKGEPLAILEGHSDSVYCFAISPDGRLLASGSSDETVLLWELNNVTLNRLLSRLPIKQMTRNDLMIVEAILRNDAIKGEQREWCKFIAELICGRK